MAWRFPQNVVRIPAVGPESGNLVSPMPGVGLGWDFQEEMMGRSTVDGTRRDRLRWLRARWVALTVGSGRDRGMSTAEYAVGTIAACAFAALLFKVVTSSEVQQMISGLINRALTVAG
ncbi:DUF4244 domain-containing protein [Streptosporangium sp. NPDC000396]|uniref:DUF4244 domain-containing protein n=1 Tax=Streptosporangium sp. NPDC000396 TaxID=3366185 RepID=UPI00368E746A